MEKIKKTLRALRKKRNYTQAQLANKLGISTRAYAKIEAGETNLTIGRLRTIAIILDVSLTELLNDIPDDNVVIAPPRYYTSAKSLRTNYKSAYATE